MLTDFILKLDELSFRVRNKYLKASLVFLVELYFSHSFKYALELAKTHLAPKCATKCKKCKCKGKKK